MGDRPFKDPSLFHHYKSTGLYGAWVRRPNNKNDRHYIGCYLTFHMAARNQDRALLYINRSATLNFKASDYDEDEQLRSTMDELAFLDMLRNEGRPKYKVVAKSPCFLKFLRMEEEMEELRRLSKMNIRQFLSQLAENPSPNADINEAAETLLEIFQSGEAEDADDAEEAEGEEADDSEEADDAEEAEEEEAEDVEEANISFIPKAKRSPRTSRKGADGVGLSSLEINKPRTRSATKRKLAATYRRPRS